jgi:hypothetical protein
MINPRMKLISVNHECLCHPFTQFVSFVDCFSFGIGVGRKTGFLAPGLDGVDQCLHMLVMRALPVDLLAGRANMELLEVQPGQWFQAIEDDLLCHWFEGVVATQAAVKWFELVG